jgi:anti-sigma-K factor RskA
MSIDERKPNGCERCADAAAFVLGALEPVEAEAFSKHLEHCPVCQEEVDALRPAVQALPMSAPQLPPPRRLRRRVLRAVRAEPGASGRRSRGLELVFPRLPRARPALGALAAAAALGIGLGLGLGLSGSSRGKLIRAQVFGISGSAELRVSAGHGELIVRHLSPPPRGQVYEVWLKAPGAKPVPASVLFTVDRTGAAEVGLPGSLHGIGLVMVTPEPRGGTRTPTHRPVIVARLT